MPTATPLRQHGRIVVSALLALFLMLYALPVSAQHSEGEHDGTAESGESRFSDEPIPLIDPVKRPRPLIELGPKFLGTGNISDGFEIPTGAVWTPAFIVFGRLRTGLNALSLNNGDFNSAVAVGRLDLFGNLYLTPTERIVVGISPFVDDGQFTRFTLTDSRFDDNPELEDKEGGFQDELNSTIRTLFMEGDIAEIFPKLDWDDSNGLDVYFSVGRQPLSFQEGLLLNEDALDMVGLTKANMKLGSLTNTRATAIFAWNEINRFGALEDDRGLLFGLFTETDTRIRTIEFDAIYITSSDDEDDDLPDFGDGVYAGLSSTRRIGQKNNNLRILASFPVGDETEFNRQGLLIVNQFAWTPHHTNNWAYITLYGGINEFRSAVRAPSAGGPLGSVGILFAATGLGNYGPAITDIADNAVGGAIGYQMFFGPFKRKQAILEVGGRYTYKDPDPDCGLDGEVDCFLKEDRVSAAARYAFALGRRFVITLDAFGAYDFTQIEGFDTDNVFNYGGRIEFSANL